MNVKLKQIRILINILIFSCKLQPNSRLLLSRHPQMTRRSIFLLVVAQTFPSSHQTSVSCLLGNDFPTMDDPISRNLTFSTDFFASEAAAEFWMFPHVGSSSRMFHSFMLDISTRARQAPEPHLHLQTRGHFCVQGRRPSKTIDE